MSWLKSHYLSLGTTKFLRQLSFTHHSEHQEAAVEELILDMIKFLQPQTFWQEEGLGTFPPMHPMQYLASSANNELYW